MHSQARAFLQPSRANIHHYQFNNLLNSIYVLIIHQLDQGAFINGLKIIIPDYKFSRITDIYTILVHIIPDYYLPSIRNIIVGIWHLEFGVGISAI